MPNVAAMLSDLRSFDRLSVHLTDDPFADFMDNIALSRYHCHRSFVHRFCAERRKERCKMQETIHPMNPNSDAKERCFSTQRSERSAWNRFVLRFLCIRVIKRLSSRDVSFRPRYPLLVSSFALPLTFIVTPYRSYNELRMLLGGSRVSLDITLYFIILVFTIHELIDWVTPPK